jgi:hydroxyethylthiazole kinase
MIISPPFLSLPELPVYDEQCVNQVMPGGFVNSGAFPVSVAMGWHGGIHIHAPNADEPVRAIADGVVVFRRDSATIKYAGNDTSTGCVVIRHTTEIGANESDKPVDFVYYSISMHLSKLDEKLPQVGKSIYRKDKLGLAGKIHGAEPRIHFEIIAGDKDIEALTGRKTTGLSLQSDGRKSVVYGTSYVFVPSGAAYFTTTTAPSSKPGAPLPASNGNTTVDLVFGIRYAQGNANLDSYQLNGAPIGTLPEPDKGEYRLYERCVALHKDSAVASPSGWYEMLRFGRQMGTDAFPTAAPHWRRVKLPGNVEGWIDLNASNTKKYSDGDFPHFMGWRLVDDDITDDNSRCQSAAIERFLNTTSEGDPVEADTAQVRMQRLCATDVQKKLAKTICKFPCEWVADEVAQRWKWVTDVDNPYNPKPIDTNGFENVQAYAKTLCFWADLPSIDKDRLTVKHWHFHPREFIIHMRKCGWLSEVESSKVFPGATALNIKKYYKVANATLRKYLICSTVNRLSKFFGQSAVESGQYTWMSELYNGDPYSYFRNYAKASNFKGWLGNVEWNDGGTFRGRGFKQLTGRNNYANFWQYKGWISADSYKPEWWKNAKWWGVATFSNPMTPAQSVLLPTQDEAAVQAVRLEMNPPNIANPDIVSSDVQISADTAGWFWAKNKLLDAADNFDIAQLTRLVRGDSSFVGVSQPWPEAAHFVERQEHTNRILKFLGDSLV